MKFGAIVFLYLIGFTNGQGTAKLRLGYDVMYTGESVTLECQISVQGIITLVTIDGFNGTRRSGTLLCKPTSGISYNNTGDGIFTGHSLSGCMDHHTQAPMFSVVITTSQSAALDYSCKALVYSSSRKQLYEVTSNLTKLKVLGSRAVSMMTLEKNYIDNGELVTFRCSIQARGTLLWGRIDAFDVNRTMGTISCHRRGDTQLYIPGSGVFHRNQLTGCASTGMPDRVLTTSIEASPTFHLHYNCIVAIHDDYLNRTQEITSNSVQLVVLGMPERPLLRPASMTFEDGEMAIIACNFPHKTPAEVITLTVRPNRGSISASNYSSNSVFLTLSHPLRTLHKAEVECHVQYLNFSHLMAHSVLHIHYIFRSAFPLVAYATSNNVTLNCSEFVDSNPSATFTWHIESYETTKGGWSYNGSSINVPKGQSGIYVCLATNDVTMKVVSTTFKVEKEDPNTIATNWWIILLTLAAAAVLVVGGTAGICIKRRKRKQKTRKSTSLTSISGKLKGIQPTQQHSTISASSKSDNEAYTTPDVASLTMQSYASLRDETFPNRTREYSIILDSALSRQSEVLSTSFNSAEERYESLNFAPTANHSYEQMLGEQPSTYENQERTQSTQFYLNA